MSTQVAEQNTRADAVVYQQKRLLAKFDRVSHYVEGLAASMYLPGIGSTFNKPVRRLRSRRPGPARGRRPSRPLLVTLEAQATTLTLTGAIAKPRGDKLVYTPIFAYDLLFPYATRERAPKALPANNRVLARRANELLAALVNYGQLVAVNQHDALVPPTFPTVVRRANGRLVAEDFTPVLGMEVENPAVDIETITVSFTNPAAKLLARRGIEYPMGTTSDELDSLVVEFRAEFPGLEIDDKTATEAVLFGAETFDVDVPLSDAIYRYPSVVAAALQTRLAPRHRFEAAHADLLVAAQNLTQPLRLSRLSRIQLFVAEELELPADYTGTTMAPVDWRPAGSPQVLAPDVESVPAAPEQVYTA